MDGIRFRMSLRRLGCDLADGSPGARHWHFAIAWFLILNGIFIDLSQVRAVNGARRVFFPARDTSNALAMFAYYVRIRKTPPARGFLQRSSTSRLHFRDSVRASS